MSLSRAACSISRDFVSETFAATAELESCRLSGQEAKCCPLQRKARNQDSHRMRWHITGDTVKGNEESLSYELQFIFQRFGLLQLLQLGGTLPLIRFMTCNSLVGLVEPHKSSFGFPPPPAYWFGKALASLLHFNFFFFLLENKKHLPTHHRLDLLVSQRPCKLLIQTFAVTLRWKEPHLARSTACCLNSSTQFIRCSYKIVMCF